MSDPPTPPPSEADPAAGIVIAVGVTDASEVNVVLFSGHAGDFEARRLNPTAEVATRFRAIAQRYAQRLADRTPVAYGAGRSPSEHEAAYVPSHEVPALAAVTTAAEAPIELELFDPASPQARNLRLYVISVHAPAGWIHCIRAKGETLRLRWTLKVAVVRRGAVYDELHDDPLLFDPDFDAMVAANTVLITNQGSFQRALGFVDQARALARETVTGLADQLAITNFDEFLVAATNDLNMVSKLRSVAAKLANPTYRAAMSTKRLVEFAAQHNLDIDIAEVEGEPKLVFHADPARRWRILKLLDDDYLHSQLTELNYEVNSKSPLRA